MTAQIYIHGSTDDAETSRLERQAAFCVPWMLDGFDAPAGCRILDVGTGVGAVAARIAARFPGCVVAGVDVQSSQVARARTNHSSVEFVVGSVEAIPFAANTFDRVHASWLIEHVANPLVALQEIRRVLCTGGYAHLTEVDNSTFRTWPVRPEIEAVISRLNEVQRARGGDPCIASRLADLCTKAGFQRVVELPRRLHGSAANLAFYRDFVDVFAAIFDSLDEALPNDLPLLRRASTALRAMPEVEHSWVEFIPRTIQAYR